jgi:hypothetical protein
MRHLSRFRSRKANFQGSMATQSLIQAYVSPGVACDAIRRSATPPLSVCRSKSHPTTLVCIVYCDKSSAFCAHPFIKGGQGGFRQRLYTPMY